MDQRSAPRLSSALASVAMASGRCSGPCIGSFAPAWASTRYASLTTPSSTWPSRSVTWTPT
uniref:Uncharacterized protein n=1 Tax=Oryza meridionalis TaxID=40149 RepID=A0A0E0FE56_9ORYZ